MTDNPTGAGQPAPTYRDWQASLASIAKKGRTYGLDLADLMYFGMSEFDESYSSLVEITEYAYSTIKSYVSVVSALPKAERDKLFDDPERRITLDHLRAVQSIINAGYKEQAVEIINGFLVAWYVNGGFWHDNPGDPQSTLTPDAGYYAAVDTFKINHGLKKAGHKTKVAKLPNVPRGDVIQALIRLGVEVIPETIENADTEQTFSLHIFAVVEEDND